MDIRNHSVEVRRPPTESNIKKLKETKGLTELMIFNTEKIGHLWAEFAEDIKNIGITTLKIFHFGRNRDSFEWMPRFNFVTELEHGSDTLPPSNILNQFENLNGLALGGNRKGRIKDANLISGVAKRVEWLTLIGRWKNCEAITPLENIKIWGLSYFGCESFDFLRGMQIEKLIIHNCKGFDKKITKELPRLIHIQKY